MNNDEVIKNNDEIIVNVGLGILIILMLAILSILILVVNEDIQYSQPVETERVLYYENDNGEEEIIRGIKELNDNIYGDINSVKLKNGEIVLLNKISKYKIKEEPISR